MKTLIKPILVSLLFTLGTLAWSAPIPLDQIIAIVDDEIILQSDLDEALTQLQNQPGFTELSKKEKYSKILNQLIDNKVLLAIARADTTINITDAEIENSVQLQLERQEENNGGKYRFAEMLKQYYGMTIEDFRDQIKKRTEEQFLMQRLQFKYTGNVSPSNKQIRDFYENYKDSLPTLYNNIKLSHLVVSVHPNRILEQAAFKKSDSLLQLLNQGLDFDTLIEQVSTSFPEIQGGDLGYIKRGSLDSDYERAAFRLSVGDYSQKPVRTKFGFHIIKSTGKKDSEVKTSHVLVHLKPSSQDTLQIIHILDSLRLVALKFPTGKNSFAELATHISEDKKTQSDGGNLGWFTAQTLNPNYKDIVDDLSEGDISPPVWLDGKLHLFKVDQRLNSRVLNLNDDWKQISFIAKNYAVEKKIQDYLKIWKKKVYIANYSNIHIPGSPLIFKN